MQSNNNSNLENRGWEGMKDLLDERMPKRGLRTWWFYVLLGIVTLFVAGYFFTQNENTQHESQQQPAREMPVARDEPPSVDDGQLDNLEGAHDEKSHDGFAASSAGKDQQEKMENGSQKVRKENTVRGNTTNEYDAKQLGRKKDVVQHKSAKQEVVAEQVNENKGRESEPYGEQGDLSAPHGTSIQDFVMESESKSELSPITLDNPTVFHIDVTIRDGVVNFPQRQILGVDVAIEDTINKKGNPSSADDELGLENNLQDVPPSDLAAQESEIESDSGAESPAETSVQAKSRYSLQLETGYTANTSSGHGPSVGLTFGTKLSDRVHFTTNLCYAMHSQEFFLYGIDESDGYYTVFVRDINNPISNDSEVFTNGIVNLGSHDRVNSTVIIRPGLSYDFLKSEKHELNFRIDGWLTYGNLHENIKISYENGFVVEGEQLVEDPIRTIMSVQQSSWGLGYGARLEYLFNIKDQYSIGLSLGHGDSYSNNYSLNFINALIKYNFG